MEKKSISKQTFNAIHVVLFIAVILLLGLTIYNFTQTGRFSFTSFVVAVIILVVISIQRTIFKKRGRVLHK